MLFAPSSMTRKNPWIFVYRKICLFFFGIAFEFFLHAGYLLTLLRYFIWFIQCVRVLTTSNQHMYANCVVIECYSIVLRVVCTPRRMQCVGVGVRWLDSLLHFLLLSGLCNRFLPIDLPLCPCVCECKLLSATVKLAINLFEPKTAEKQKCPQEKRVIFHPFCRIYRSMSICLCVCVWCPIFTLAL